MKTSHLTVLVALCLLLVAGAASAQRAPAADLPLASPGASDAPSQAPHAVTLSLVLPTETDPDYTGHPAWRTDVNPLLFDLVTMAEPGTIRIDAQDGLFAVVTATLAPNALTVLSKNPWVVSIDPAIEPVVARPPQTTLKAACTPTSSQACVQGNRFGITATIGGTIGFVAATSSASATFYQGNSANWEVLVKVLNACVAPYNRWWVFAAGATTQSVSFTVRDFNTGAVKAYAGAACPVTDTNAFPCP